MEGPDVADPGARTLIGALPGSAVFLFDVRGRYRLADGESLRDAGLSPGDFVGKSIEDVAPPERAARMRAMLERALGGETFVDEHELGGRVYVSRGGPLRSESGEVEGVLVVSHDVTRYRHAEREVQSLAAQRQLALDAARLGWWHYDPVGERSWWDRRFREIFGIDSDAGESSVTLGLIHPDDLPGVRAAVARALDPGDPADFEAVYRVRRPDGRTVWVEAHGVGTFEGEGAERRATGLVGTVADVTERVRAEAALAASEERLRLATQGGRVGIWEVDLGSGQGEWTPEAVEILGADGARFSAWDWDRVVHPDDRAMAVAAWERAVASEEGLRLEFRTARPAPDDGERWVLSRGRIERDASGRAVRAIGAMVDLTEQRRAQGTLYEREALLRAVIEGTPDLVWTRDLNGRTTMANRAVVAFLGRGSAEDVLGRTVEELVSDAAVVAAWKANDAQVVREGRAAVVEEEAVTPSGRRVFQTVKAPLRDASGRLTGLLGVARDVTDARRHAEGLRRLAAVSSRLLRGGSPAELAEGVYEELGAHLGLDVFLCYRCTHDGGTLELIASAGLSAEAGEAVRRVTLGQQVCGETARARRVRYMPSIATLDAPGAAEARELGLRSYLSTPLSSDGRLLGVMSFGSRTRDGLDEEERELVRSATLQFSTALERRVAEEAVREREALLSGVLQSTPDLVWAKDASGLLTAANDAVARAVGREAVSEVLGLDASGLVGDPEQAARIWANDRAVMGAGEARKVEEEVGSGAERRVFESIKSPLRDAQGRVVGIVGVSRDVTAERRRAGVLAGLAEISARLLGGGEPAELAEAVFAELKSRLGADVFFCYRAQEGPEPSLRLLVCGGVDATAAAGLERMAFGAGVCGMTAAKRAAAYVTGIQRSEEPAVAALRSLGLRCYVCTPLMAGGRLLGTLSLGWRGRESLEPEELDLVRAASLQFATAIDRRDADEALRESEARFRAMADGLPVLVWVHGADGALSMINATYCGFYGITPERALGSGWRALLHPEDEAAYVEAWEASTRGRTAFRARARVRDGLGRWRWMESWAQPRFGAAGAFLGHVGASIDITEQREAAAALEESEARFRQLADAMPQAVWVATADGTNVYWNQRAPRIFGLEMAQMLGGGWVNIVHPEDQERVARVWAECVATGAAYECEYRVHAPGVGAEGGPAWRWSLARGEPVRDAAGRIARWLGTNTDIDDLKLAQEELSLHRGHLERLVAERTAELGESHERLRMSERMAAMGTLSAGLGHDMGNLLMPIRVRLETLAAAGLPEELKRDVEAIRTSAEYLQRLSSGLRMLAIDPARARTGEVTELGPWWAEAAGVMRSVLPRSVGLTEALPAGAPSVRIPRAALTQAVFNLVQNAGDALRERAGGSIRVSAQADAGTVRLVVEDDGPGMSEEVRRRCVEPFFTTKARGISTGLGLPLVYGLVHDAGGRVELESRPGVGTRFTLVLPAGEAPSTDGVPVRTARVEIGDARMRSFVCGELRALGLRVSEGGERPAAADLAVVDDAEKAAAFGAGVVTLLLGESGESGGSGESRPGVRALGRSPQIARIREAIREAASSGST